jgi:hypothetical protein
MKFKLVLALFLMVSISYGQKRIKPPKGKSNIASVDKFVVSAFKIYNTVYDYSYSPSEPVQESTDESQDEGTDEFEVMEEEISNLLELAPDIIDEIDQHSVARQVKASLHMKKATRALNLSKKMIRENLIPSEE